jgi:hypothetical protein
MQSRALLRKVLWSAYTVLAISAPALAQQSRESIVVGQWHEQFQTPQGSGDLYIEYLRDGQFRGVIYTPTQPMTEAQSFGTYTAQQEGADQVRVHRTISRRLPLMLCEPNGGNCRPVPSGPTEVDAVFRIARDGSLVDAANMTLRREAIPQQFLQVIPDRIFLHQVPAVAQTGSRPAAGLGTSNPAIPGPVHMTPQGERGNGPNCDDLQQNRLCTVNNGYMYTDKRGCRMCQGPN